MLLYVLQECIVAHFSDNRYNPFSCVCLCVCVCVWLHSPNMGYLHVEYYSGRDKSTGKLAGLEGCAPVWKLREQMMENVLLGTYGNRKLSGM